MTLTEKFNEIAELANVAPIPEVFGLNAEESFLANKEAEQDSKGIDWAEFDKQDQIIMSSND